MNWGTLDPDRWVADSVITAYMHLLAAEHAEHAAGEPAPYIFSTLLLSAVEMRAPGNEVQVHLRRVIGKFHETCVTFSGAPVYLLPQHHNGNHWRLFVLRPDPPAVWLVDSMAGSITHDAGERDLLHICNTVLEAVMLTRDAASPAMSQSSNSARLERLQQVEPAVRARLAQATL
jgi:Ulp1 family protease